MKVIISIPAYNEESSLGSVLKNIKQVMSKTKYKYQLLVVDDGSTDATASIAQREGALVMKHHYNRGLAETFRTEIKKCLELHADVIVHTDADGQYLAQDIPRLLKEIENGYDLVLGSRFKGKIESMSLLKRLGNMAFSAVISRIIRYKIADCQTGFRAFTKEVAQLPSISTHTYTQEQIIRAVRNNLKIKEVPVYFAKRDGKSRLLKNPFEYAIKAWINILRIYRDYEPLKFFGSIGATFLLVGFCIGLWLVSIFMRTGKVGRLPFTILTMLLIVVGIQIILFGFLAEKLKT